MESQMYQYVLPLAIAAAAHADVIVVDDFADGAFSQSISSGDLVGQDAATVLGDQRDYALAVGSNDFGQSLDASVTAGVGLFVSAGVGLDGQFWLQYDGNGDVEDDSLPFDNDGGLALDLTAYDAFEINFISLDLDMEIEVGVFNVDDDGNVENLSGGAFTLTAGTNFTQTVSFEDLIGDADFSDVNGINFGFNTAGDSPDRDYAISSITIVPAPSAAAVIALAAIAYRRRR